MLLGAIWTAKTGQRTRFRENNGRLLRARALLALAIAAQIMDVMHLDNYDVKILGLLQRDSKISQRELSEAVNLSPSAVNRRIAALESAGVIAGTVCIVDPSSVGHPITIVVEVKLESERLDLLDEVKTRFADCPQVQQVYYVTGEYDFVLVMVVKDMTEYEQLTRDLFFSSGNVKGFRTYVAMQRVKVTLNVPLAEQ